METEVSVRSKLKSWVTLKVDCGTSEHSVDHRQSPSYFACIFATVWYSRGPSSPSLSCEHVLAAVLPTSEATSSPNFIQKFSLFPQIFGKCLCSHIKANIKIIVMFQLENRCRQLSDHLKSLIVLLGSSNNKIRKLSNLLFIAQNTEIIKSQWLKTKSYFK